MSVLASFGWNFLSKGLGLLLVLVSGAILYRTIGAEGKGAVEALVGWTTMLLLLAPPMEEPQLYVLGRKEVEPSRLFANALVLALLVGAFVFLGFEVLLRIAPDLFTYRDLETGARVPMDLDALRQLLCVAPLVVAQRLVGGLLQGLRDLRAFNLIFLGQNVALLAFVCVLVLGSDLGWRGALHAQTIAMGTGGVLAILLALRNPRLREGPFRPHLTALRGLLRSGVRLHGGVVAAWIIIESDRLVIFHARGPEEVGIYGLAVALTGHLRRLFVQPAKEVLGSRLPEMVGDRERMLEAIARATRHTVVLVLVPTLLLGATGQLVILILGGEDLLPAYAPLLVLLPGNVAWAAAVMAGYWFIGEGRYLVLSLVGLVIAASNLIGNLIFVPEYGLMAAAVTSSACYALHLSIFLALLARETGRGAGAFLKFGREDLKVYGAMLAKVRGKLGR